MNSLLIHYGRSQAELLLKQSQAVEIPKAKKELNYLPEVIWKPYEKATDKQKEEAKAKLAPLHKLDDLVRNNVALMMALDAVSSEYEIAKGSLKRWYYKVRSFERRISFLYCWINTATKKLAKKQTSQKKPGRHLRPTILDRMPAIWQLLRAFKTRRTRKRLVNSISEQH